MTTPDILPFASVRGSWGAMGEQLGQIFAPLIGNHLDAWIDHVTRETGATRNPLWSSRTTRPSEARRISASRRGLMPEE